MCGKRSVIEMFPGIYLWQIYFLIFILFLPNGKILWLQIYLKTVHSESGYKGLVIIIREIVTSKHNFHLPSVSTISTMCAIHFSGALVLVQIYLSRHIVQATTKIVYFDVNKDRLENQRKKTTTKTGSDVRPNAFRIKNWLSNFPIKPSCSVAMEIRKWQPTLTDSNNKYLVICVEKS